MTDDRVPKRLFVTTRAGWRAWLEKNHEREREIWLVYNKRHTGRARVEYDDAVCEALCFGWIDGMVKRIDDERYGQRFTPRRPGSRWSELNRRRYARLAAEGRLAPPGAAKAPPPRARGEKLAPKPARGETVPRWVERAFKRRPLAWRNFTAMAPSYRRLYVGWIAAAAKPETRQRRLAEATDLLARNQKLGMK